MIFLTASIGVVLAILIAWGIEASKSYNYSQSRGWERKKTTEDSSGYIDDLFK